MLNEIEVHMYMIVESVKDMIKRFYAWNFPPPPKVGSMWRIKDDNPFNESINIIVHAVRDDYIKYRYMSGIFETNRIHQFKRLFKEVSNELPPA